MDETKISKKAYNESYFMFYKLISELFIIPLILYNLRIAFITHISTFNPPLKTHINLNLSKKRKILFLILIFLYLGKMISIFKVSNLESSASSISNSITLITLLFYIMDILGVLFTVYFLEEKNEKQIKINKHDPLQIFIALNIIYFLFDLVNEIIYGIFTFLTPITFCYLIYLQIFYYQNPIDSDTLLLAKGSKFIAWTECYGGLINKNQNNIKKNNYNLRASKKYIPMSNYTGRISMIGSENFDLNNDDEKNKTSRVNSNEGNNKINLLINNLYDPNNSDYLQNSYEGLLDIKIKFQSNFFIDYGSYYNNKTKENKLNKEKEKNNNKDKEIPLLNNQDEVEINSEDNPNVANFYTSIIFNFNVIATSSYYVTNKNLSKSLAEFFQLDNIIENEFTEDRYNISLIKNLPKLNLKKCFEDLSINKEDNDNNDILLDCIQNTKNICEKYIKDIISNPHFIIPEVLFFLEISDKNIFQIYININQQIKKKDDNLLRSLSRKEDSYGLFISANNNCIFSNNEFGSIIDLKIIKGDFINDKNAKNKNDKKLDNKNYLILISLNYEDSTKYIRKKFEDTIFILQEVNKILFINNQNLKNSKNEISTNLMKNYSEFVSIYNKINKTNFAPNQSFKLKVNNSENYIFKKYSFSDIKNEDDLFYSFIMYIENILQILINYYLEEIFNSIQIIKEYFFDFIDDYWSVEKLKKYIKYNNNFINLLEKEISEKSINNIFVIDKNYLCINTNYKENVFYILYFKITTETNFIQLEKKYDFEEVKNYIDLMKVELGLSLVWPKRCFESNDCLNEDKIENIHSYRLNLMSTYLNKIFNANKIFNIKNWKKIFYDDKIYLEVCDIKLKEKKKENKKMGNILEKKSSFEEFFVNGNKKNIRNIEKDNEIINESPNENENMSSFEYQKNDLYLKSDGENMNSFGTLNSNISKNSKVKNLLDI